MNNRLIRVNTQSISLYSSRSSFQFAACQNIVTFRQIINIIFNAVVLVLVDFYKALLQLSLKVKEKKLSENVVIVYSLNIAYRNFQALGQLRWDRYISDTPAHVSPLNFMHRVLHEIHVLRNLHPDPVVWVKSQINNFYSHHSIQQGTGNMVAIFHEAVHLTNHPQPSDR